MISACLPGPVGLDLLIVIVTEFWPMLNQLKSPGYQHPTEPETIIQSFGFLLSHFQINPRPQPHPLNWLTKITK